MSRYAAALLSLPLTMCIHAAASAAPVNDDCEDARVAKLGGNPFTNVGATVEPPATCAIIGADIWFKFTSTFTGTLLVSTCSETSFDTIITVYSGCSCSSFTQLDCNVGCFGGEAVVEAPVQAGACYRIRVAGLNAATGTGLLTLSVEDPENAAAAHAIKTGNAAGDRFGSALAGNGRINGDAVEDIIIGAPFNDQAQTDAGRAFAYRGSSNLAALLNRTGTGAGERFGAAVALTDVNDDGRDDLIIGAPFAIKPNSGGSRTGAVHAYSGFSGGLLWTRYGVAQGDQFGYSVAPAGDFNNAGRGDIIVGAPFNDAGGLNAGRAYVLNGVNGNTLKTLNGRSAGDNFGYAVANIGDLNNDGRDDLAVGAPKNDTGANNAGQVTVFAGGSGAVIKRFDGDASGDRFGHALAGRRFTAGGAQYVMMAVGAPTSNNGGGVDAGRVKVFLRNLTFPNQNDCNSPLCLKYTINGGNAGDRFGTAVAVGDLVGNAIADIVVGSPNIGINGSKSGAVYIFDGALGTQAGKFYGEAAGDTFASTVAIAGDVNNDGADDIIVGSPNNDAKGSNAGRAYVFFINPAALRGSDAPPPGASHADLTGDGLIDHADLAAVINAWGACVAAASCPSDLDGSGTVDANDLLEVIKAWRRWADPVVIVQ